MAQLSLLTEPEPARGRVLPVAPGVARIVAPNPGPMTYHGTNTYLIEEDGGFTLVDPGPDDPGHRAAILAAGRIRRIVLTHTHVDHVAGLPALRGGVEVLGFSDLADTRLRDGDMVAGWRAVHTPGHAPDHLCFARADGVVISGDHIMGWSSTVVSPPDGDMTAYFASLHRMLAEGGHTYLPGHGPAIADPAGQTRALLAHRQAREDAIAAALGGTVAEMTAAIYADLAPHLRPAAERNVAAHLAKLAAEGRAAERGGVWRATR